MLVYACIGTIVCIHEMLEDRLSVKIEPLENFPFYYFNTLLLVTNTWKLLFREFERMRQSQYTSTVIRTVHIHRTTTRRAGERERERESERKANNKSYLTIVTIAKLTLLFQKRATCIYSLWPSRPPD